MICYYLRLYWTLKYFFQACETLGTAIKAINITNALTKVDLKMQNRLLKCAVLPQKEKHSKVSECKEQELEEVTNS